MALTSRERLLNSLSCTGGVSPPRYEREFSDGVIAAWRSQGHLGDQSPEEFFGLDQFETVSVDWHRAGERTVVETQDDLVAFRRAYDATLSNRFPEDWERLVAAWQARDFALTAAPWSEGQFQVMGVRNGNTFNRAMVVLCEQPQLVEALMETYADYLEALIPRVLERVEIDFALFYEPIAWARAPVISPRDYARFTIPTLKRVVALLGRFGVEYHVIRATGEVRPLIPLWLDAGINGLMVTQTAVTGIQYPALRREYGSDLRLFGGIDWQAVTEGPTAIDSALAETVNPLLESGGYIPHLDDTVRAYCPFEHYSYYRRRLDALLAD